MNRRLSTLLLAAAVTGTSGLLINRAFAEDVVPTTAPTTVPTSQPAEYIKAASYGIGHNFGQQMIGAPVKLDAEEILRGVRDSLAGKPSEVNEAQLQAAIMQVQQDMMKAQQELAEMETAKSENLAEVNKAFGTSFREGNAKVAGVTTTATGLQIQTITEGTGPNPKATDVVKVHYTGTRIDGTKFDSSVDRGEPVSFPLNQVIPGWTEGLQLMKVGGKSKLVIPPDIAYGDNPRPGGVIQPGDTLVFEVELIAIENAPAADGPK